MDVIKQSDAIPGDVGRVDGSPNLRRQRGHMLGDLSDGRPKYCLRDNANQRITAFVPESKGRPMADSMPEPYERFSLCQPKVDGTDAAPRKVAPADEERV
ncbi:unnamed protein product, partial [Mesorhabditis spiculigera]